VQDVRYAPSGDHFASVGSDGKIFLYDGKAGDTVGEFSEGHAGTAVSQARLSFYDRTLKPRVCWLQYALSWSPDSKAISTCSADATVKLCTSDTLRNVYSGIDIIRPGDVETRKATTTYTLGTGLQHQQVGNVWTLPDTVVSLSFSGNLNVFDRRSGEKKPVKVLHVRDE
jgi:WD40 repeat protein